MLKPAPPMTNSHDQISDWRDYIDKLPPDQNAEFVVSAFTDNHTILECLLYASSQGVPVLFQPENKVERDYNPYND